MAVKTVVERRYKPKHPFLSGGIAGGLEILATFPLELGAEFTFGSSYVDVCSSNIFVCIPCRV